MGTHPIFESDFDCLTEWTIWYVFADIQLLVKVHSFLTISDHFEIIRLDDLFISDYKNEKENRKKAKDKAEQVLRIGKNVVIDDTNHLESMRHYWFSLAAELKSIFVIIWMKTEFEVCQSRNEERI